MHYKLIREKTDGNAVRGTLYIVHHRDAGNKEILRPICRTLENKKYMVLPLIYHIAVTMSPKFKRLLPILKQVPGRTGIRFHRGTKPEHSLGCILVSTEDEQLITARWLAEQSAKEEIIIDIVEARSGKFVNRKCATMSLTKISKIHAASRDLAGAGDPPSLADGSNHAGAGRPCGEGGPLRPQRGNAGI